MAVVKDKVAAGIDPAAKATLVLRDQTSDSARGERREAAKATLVALFNGGAPTGSLP